MEAQNDVFIGLNLKNKVRSISLCKLILRLKQVCLCLKKEKNEKKRKEKAKKVLRCSHSLLKFIVLIFIFAIFAQGTLWCVISYRCFSPFRPRDLKLPKNFQFPGKGVIYDFFFDKSTFGTWHPWEKNVFIEEIPPSAKVGLLSPRVLCSFYILL